MERMASIELAMKNEKTEMEFYLNEANRSKNPLAREMFQLLAKDEEEHLSRISKLHGELLGKGNWPGDVPIVVKGTRVTEVLDGLVRKKGSAVDHNDDDVQALEKAAVFEDKGVGFYHSLADACTNPMEKNFFNFLSKIEREHLVSIKDTLEYFKDPEGWMRNKEHSGLDGA